MSRQSFNVAAFLPYIRTAVSRRLDRLAAIDRLFLDAIDREELQAECEQQAALYACEYADSLATATDLSPDDHKQLVSRACIRAVDRATSDHWIASRPIKPRRLRITELDTDTSARNLPTASAAVSDDHAYLLHDDLLSWLSGQQDPDIAIWSLIHWRDHSTLDVACKLRKSTRDVCAANRRISQLVEQFVSLWCAEHIPSAS